MLLHILLHEFLDAKFCATLITLLSARTCYLVFASGLLPIITKLRYLRVFGYPDVKSYITRFLAGCMGLLGPAHILQWLILHGQSRILRSFGEFLIELSEFILHAIHQDCRHFPWKDQLLHQLSFL